jgi:hypothetical protein
MCRISRDRSVVGGPFHSLVVFYSRGNSRKLSAKLSSMLLYTDPTCGKRSCIHCLTVTSATPMAKAHFGVSSLSQLSSSDRFSSDFPKQEETGLFVANLESASQPS